MIPLFKVKMSPNVGEEVSKVLSSGFIGQGQKVEDFEDLLWKELGTETRPITVNSCTTAIDLALELIGIEPGDEIISTAQTCLHYDSPVLLGDGTFKKIGNLVDEKFDGCVKSYNEKTKEFENKKVYNWVKVPVEKDDWYRLTIKQNEIKNNPKYSPRGIYITADHKVLSNRGWVRVDQLNENDLIATNYLIPNKKQMEFVNGILLGDGWIQKHKEHNSYRLGTCHTKNHESYVIQTKNILKIESSLINRPSIIKNEKVVTNESLVYQSYSGVSFKPLYKKWYSNKNIKIVPDDLEITPIVLAAWYMDDGNFNNRETRCVQFSTEGFSYESFWKLFYKMVSYGFKPTAVKKGKGYVIRLGERNGDIDNFFQQVSKYILPCFRYKVPKGFDDYDPEIWDLGNPEIFFSEFKLNKEHPKHNSAKYAYCLDVEDNHNFLTNDILVHNCFASNVGAIHKKAKIVWADIDSVTGCIDPESVKSLITKKTKAIIAVDWAGKYCNFKELKLLGIPIIEDAAHVWDSKNLDFGIVERGDYICYSFQAIKYLTTGDGGILICPKDKELSARLLRWYGLDRNKGQSFRCTQDIELAGFKYHMNDIAATIGICNLSEARNSVKKQKSLSKILCKYINNDDIIVPEFDINCSYWLFSLHVLNNRKQEFINYLSDNGITSSPVHFRNDLYTCTKEFYREGLFNLESFTKTQVCIPNGWWLSDDNLGHIIETINKF